MGGGSSQAANLGEGDVNVIYTRSLRLNLGELLVFEIGLILPRRQANNALEVSVQMNKNQHSIQLLNRFASFLDLYIFAIMVVKKWPYLIFNELGHWRRLGEHIGHFACEVRDRLRQRRRSEHYDEVRHDARHQVHGSHTCSPDFSKLIHDGNFQGKNTD